MTAQEFSEYLEKGLGLYEKYKEIEYKYKEPEIPEIPAVPAAVEEEKKAPNYVLYTIIGLGTIALIVYAVKKR